MAFTTTISTTSSLDDSIVLAYAQAGFIASGQNNVMDQFVSERFDIGAKSIAIPKYARLAVSTTPLTETEDASSDELTDAGIVITPAEYGKVVTRSALASLQTGGRADLAAAATVGINLGQTTDKLAIEALDASTNNYVVSGAALADLAANAIMSGSTLNVMYNKLARQSVPTINGSYVMVAHDDVIADLRADTATGSWTDVSKYATPETVLKNEVGMYKGFRVVRDNQATFADQTGAGTVDVYNSYFFGFNALGKAVSKEPTMTFSGPFDKLGRFVNVGWYGVLGYKIVDQDAVWKVQSASSVGANAA